MKRSIAMAFLISTSIFAIREQAARAADCLKPEPAFVADTTFVALSFLPADSDEARVVETVILGDRTARNPWIVRRCDDKRLLDGIKRGDKAQLDELLNRRIILVVFPENASFKHHIIPYEQLLVTSRHEVPPAAEVGMCHGGQFDMVETCKRYAGPAQGLMAIAIALYKLNLPRCPELEDAENSLTEALGGLAKISDPVAKKTLRDFMLLRSDELKQRAGTLGCSPRDLNLRLLKDRRGTS